jgi:hypothetical protein
MVFGNRLDLADIASLKVGVKTNREQPQSKHALLLSGLRKDKYLASSLRALSPGRAIQKCRRETGITWVILQA